MFGISSFVQNRFLCEAVLSPSGFQQGRVLSLRQWFLGMSPLSMERLNLMARAAERQPDATVRLQQRALVVRLRPCCREAVEPQHDSLRIVQRCMRVTLR